MSGQCGDVVKDRVSSIVDEGEVLKSMAVRGDTGLLYAQRGHFDDTPGRPYVSRPETARAGACQYWPTSVQGAQ